MIGSDAGQAAKVVHVYGLICPSRSLGGGIYLDRYAVLDGDGRFLAGFPSGADAPFGAEGPKVSDYAAWYLAKDVARLAGSAGLVFSQDQVDTPQEVIDRYPGLYEYARRAARYVYFSTLLWVPAGLLFIVTEAGDQISLVVSEGKLIGQRQIHWARNRAPFASTISIGGPGGRNYVFAPFVAADPPDSVQNQ